MVSGKREKRNVRLEQLKMLQAKAAPHIDRLPEYAQRGKETLQRFFPPEGASGNSHPVRTSSLDLPAVADIRAKWTEWKQPRAKLTRQKQRASRAFVFCLIVTILFGVYGFLVGNGALGNGALGEGSPDINKLVISVAGLVIFGTLSVRAGAKFRRVSRELNAFGPTAKISPVFSVLPPRGSSIRSAVERLNEAEASLANLCEQFPKYSIDADVLASAEDAANQTAAALRALADRIQAVERARDLASTRDRDGLDSAVHDLVAQFEEGLAGYQDLVTAAAHMVVAASGQDASTVVSKDALTEATDHLSALASALRELGGSRT